MKGSGVQETHMKGSGVVKVDKDYELFYSGSEDNKHHGVGMLVNRALKPQYTANTTRICQMKCYVKEKPLICICTYAQQRHHQTRTQKKETTTIKNLKILSGRYLSVTC